MVELTQKLVLSLFSYRDGNLFWKVQKGKRGKIGNKAGTLSHGYYRVKIDGKQYANHRLIYLMYHGYIPFVIDHIDGDSGNNNIDNLQDISFQNNVRKQKITLTFDGKPTSSHYKGVTWHDPTKQWRSRIWVDNKNKHLGLFKSEDAAAEAYNKAAIESFGEYACLNIIDDSAYGNPRFDSGGVHAEK